jgi:hypothetical protein
MATEELNRSTSQGATPPPSPSPSAAAPEMGGTPSRLKRLQPQPVGSRVYQAIAEVNSGFEILTHRLQALEQFNFFPADNLTAWLNVVLHLQAEANSLLLESLDHREMNNAAYYDGLCMEWERQLADPDDVLIEAERRRQELAAEHRDSADTE